MLDLLFAKTADRIKVSLVFLIFSVHKEKNLA